MSSWFHDLVAHAPVLLDGAWGTQLQARGLEAGASPDALNLDRPEVVVSVGRDYVEAGSGIILTNTFGANRRILERHGLADRVDAINRAGVRAGREAADGRARVFGSVGPSGAMLMMGDVEPADLESVFAEQVSALADGGVDALVVETLADLEEARIAVAAAVATGLPVVACMAFDSGPDRDRTMMGVSVAEAAAAFADLGASAVGANCGQDVAGYIRLAESFRTATPLPLWLKPNAGQPSSLEGKTVYAQTPEAFAEGLARLADLGVAFLGGCCGTSPEFIRAARERLGI